MVSLKVKAAAELELRRRRAARLLQPLTFREFINKVNPKYRWSEMSDRLVDLLQDVADKKRQRLMIFLPPRHGKSELVTRMFSAYYLYRYPSEWVGINSYAAELAYTFSRASRANFRQAGGQISDESASVKHWETQQKGGCWAAGVGGPITGKGFHLGLVDDPLKNHEEATSATIRNKQKDWWDSTFYTRAEEGSAIVVIQTRWHGDDLSGWLLSREYDPEPERWHVVSWEAIKEDHSKSFPPACTIAPDWRKSGEPLNPARMSLGRLGQICARIRGYFWTALYQQRPRPPEGNVFKEGWLRYYKKFPELEGVYVSVDASFKQTKKGSFVVVQAWGVAWPRFYLLMQVRERMGFVGTKKAIRQTCDRLKDEFGMAPSAVLIEDKANGPAVIDELKGEIPGILAISPKGSKAARAEAVSSYYQSGNVWLPSPELSTFPVSDYTEELLAFPEFATDDQVDASSQFISWVVKKRSGNPAARRPVTTRVVNPWE